MTGRGADRVVDADVVVGTGRGRWGRPPGLAIASGEVGRDGAGWRARVRAISQPQGARVRPDIPLHLYACRARWRTEGAERRTLPARPGRSRGRNDTGADRRGRPPAGVRHAVLLYVHGELGVQRWEADDDDGIRD
jgi:hypothetical protein